VIKIHFVDAAVYWDSTSDGVCNLMRGNSCCMVVCAQAVESVRVYGKVCLLYHVWRHVASTQGRSMTNGANFK